jgi:hypothetical protein
VTQLNSQEIKQIPVAVQNASSFYNAFAHGYGM